MKPEVIAVTGGIGSGKSAVLDILCRKGFTVIFCDKIAKEISREKDVLRAVRDLLGENSVSNDELNREFVREKVFADESLYLKYSSLFWERTKQRLLEAVAVAAASADLTKNKTVIFVEIPVINAFTFDWSEIWLVESDEKTRTYRVSERDGSSLNNIKEIMARQLPVKNYTRKIANNGTFAELEAAVDKELKAVLR